MKRLRLDEYLPYRLSVASNEVSKVISRTYETRFGLKIPEWRLIAVLADDGEMTQLQLLERTAMDKVTISRAAQALVDRGLVKKTQDQRDGRSRRLALTEEGLRLHADVGPAALEMERELLEPFSAQEVATLTDLLRRLEARARG